MKTLRRFSRNRYFSHARITVAVMLMAAAAAMVFVAVSPPASAQPAAPKYPLTPKFSPARGFHISPALRDLRPPALVRRSSKLVDMEIRRERGPELKNRGHSPDGALQTSPRARTPGAAAVAIPAPLQNFEGLSNLDNFNVFGFRVNPPDNMGDVGPNHYVQLINLVLGIFDKTGTKLVGPVDIGALWAGFAVPDCTDPSGDPVSYTDQLTDRWILSQFTTSGLDDPDKPFWNCVAISTTGDPTGTYYRYAFETAHFQFFPDYPNTGSGLTPT